MARTARQALARLLPIPTGRFVAVAAALSPVAAALAPFGVVRTLLAVNAALLALLLGDAAAATAAGRFTVARDLPPVLTIGTGGTVTWRVRNGGRGARRVQLADELAPSLGAERRRVGARVPGGGRVTLRTELRPDRRGRFAPTEVVLRVRGPLGLGARQETHAVPGEVRVYPPFRSRAVAELRLLRAQLLQAGRRVAAGRGAGGEFDGLREYGPDDEFRRIDWAATARADRAIVRTYRAERNQTVLLLVDSGRTMAGQVAEGDGRRRAGLADVSWTEPRLDHAIDAAMALTLVATGMGDAAGLVAFADRVRAMVAPRAREDQLGRVTAALYGLAPVLAESDYTQAFSATLTRFRRRALLVVLTELGPEPIAATLLPALPLVLRDHLVMIAGVRDPEVERWARAVPGDATTAYRKAAAVQALEQRHRTVRRLRRLGAIVVDEVPGRLAGTLADRYLEVKAAGRL